MRRIFLDCGGHCGESVLKFLPQYPEHDFYTFEANPDLSQHIITNVRSTTRVVFFYPGAVWTFDGFLDFFIGHDQGSTAVTGKHEYFEGVQQVNYDAPVRVPCIDLSSWIIRNTTLDDHVVLKLDVEGAEYEILPKMISDGSLDRIDILYCEWHFDRFEHITKDFHENIFHSVKEKTDLRDWF